MGQDLRGEGRLAGAALDVQVRSVAQGVDSSICAAGDDKLDRQDRVQPLCGLLWGQSRRERSGQRSQDQSLEGPPPSSRRGALICPSPGSPPSIPGDRPAELTSR